MTTKKTQAPNTESPVAVTLAPDKWREVVGIMEQGTALVLAQLNIPDIV